MPSPRSQVRSGSVSRTQTSNLTPRRSAVASVCTSGQVYPPAPACYVVAGVSGSGKSTLGILLAQRLGPTWQFFDGDDFHTPANIEKMKQGQALDDEDRWPWLQRLAVLVAETTGRGERLVVACSALKLAYRQMLAERCKPDAKGNSNILFVVLQPPRAELERRLQDRIKIGNHFMPPTLLASQLADQDLGAIGVDMGSKEQSRIIWCRPPGDSPLVIFAGAMSPAFIADTLNTAHRI